MIAREQDGGPKEEVITVPKLAAEGALSREGAGGALAPPCPQFSAKLLV